MSTPSPVERRFWQYVTTALVSAAAIYVLADGATAPAMPSAESVSAVAKPARITRSIGKSSGLFRVVSPARFRAHTGEVVRVSLELLAIADVEEFQARATVDPALVIVASDQDSVTTKVPAGTRLTLNYEVQPQAEGLSYVNVIFSGQTLQGRRMGSYSIPVEVGDRQNRAAAKVRPPSVVDENGVLLQVMRAREDESLMRDK